MSTKPIEESDNSLFDSEKTWFQRDFGLDSRLIKALARLNYRYPTKVQSKCLPIALQGKDILVRARTGSGKTVAFALPMLQKVLTMKENAISNGEELSAIRCIVLAPTRELLIQIEKNMNDLIYYCREHITICSLTDDNQRVLDYRLQSKPDILLSTPAKLAQQLTKSSHGIDLLNTAMLVVDEADLVLSYGFKADVHTILTHMPKIFQGMFLSATLSPELEKFKKLVLHKPVILKLEEERGAGNLLQFYLEASEADKYLVLYVFLKLGLLQGKGLIFVNDVNKCYRLKLFLQQFYIQTAVLNAEVPQNSRAHILDEFNRGLFDYLIATDASIDDGEEDDSDDDEDAPAADAEADADGSDEEADDEDNESGSDEEGEDAEDDGEDEDEASEEETAGSGDEEADPEAEAESAPVKKAAKKAQVEKDEYGVSRGIDFQGVNFVINFDFPQSTAAYTHRIGRTARGMNSGTSLSFVTRATPGVDHEIDVEVSKRDYAVLEDVRSKQPRLGVVEGDNILAAIGATEDSNSDEMRMQPAPLMFNFAELESFRYRVNDTFRAVTNVAVRELRTAEIRREVLNSEKLKTYFAENPNDLKVLRHDKVVLHPIRQQEHLKFVPTYLIPASMRTLANTTTKKRGKRKNTAATQESRMKKSKQNDPLYAARSSTNEEKDDGYGVAQAVPDKSGRKEWQERHKKGSFNPRNIKKNSDYVQGSFAKKRR